MVFPAGKLASVIIRQVSKPLASFLQARAQQNTVFKNICISFAEMYNNLEFRIVRSFYYSGSGSSKTRYIPKMDEKRAIELGASALGESMLLGVAIGVVAFEYRRGQLKEVKKELELNEKLMDLKHNIEQLHMENDWLISSVFPDYKHNRPGFLEKPEPEINWYNFWSSRKEQEGGDGKGTDTAALNFSSSSVSSQPPLAESVRSNGGSSTVSAMKTAKDENKLVVSPSGIVESPLPPLIETRLNSGTIVRMLPPDLFQDKT